jgi:hypothetical protein
LVQMFNSLLLYQSDTHQLRERKGKKKKSSWFCKTSTVCFQLSIWCIFLSSLCYLLEHRREPYLPGKLIPTAHERKQWEIDTYYTISAWQQCANCWKNKSHVFPRLCCGTLKDISNPCISRKWFVILHFSSDCYCGIL